MVDCRRPLLRRMCIWLLPYPFLRRLLPRHGALMPQLQQVSGLAENRVRGAELLDCVGQQTGSIDALLRPLAHVNKAKGSAGQPRAEHATTTNHAQHDAILRLVQYRAAECRCLSGAGTSVGLWPALRCCYLCAERDPPRSLRWLEWHKRCMLVDGTWPDGAWPACSACLYKWWVCPWCARRRCANGSAAFVRDSNVCVR